MYGLKVNVPPPLPAQTSTLAWMCLTQGWIDASYTARRFSWYWFYAFPDDLGPFNAMQTSQDWAARTHGPWVGTYHNTTGSTSIYTFAWDGTRLHTGASSILHRGGLTSILKKRDPAYSVLVKRLAYHTGRQIIGYWRSAPVSSAWADPGHRVTSLGGLQFTNWVNVIATNFVTEGNTWFPAVFSRKYNRVFKMAYAQMFPTLHYYHKHRIPEHLPVHSHDNTWVYPTLNP